MLPKPMFPTPQHQAVAEIVHTFFLRTGQIDTLLIVNSCARGQATPGSDLDIAALTLPDLEVGAQVELESQWNDFARANTTLTQFKQGSRFRAVHLDVIDGKFVPSLWDDGGGPDHFELSIGNHVAYAACMETPGKYFNELVARWMPYYSEELQAQRLAMVQSACLYDLDFIPFYVGRGLHFQAFDRLYKAFREFLQALFIHRHTYPIAYNKWIQEQVDRRLGLPDLYRELPSILSISNLETHELIDKARMLRSILERWTS